MRRRLFDFAAGVSLVLCLGTVGFWVNSFNRYYRAEYLPQRPKSFVVFVGRGGLAAGPFERGPQDSLPCPTNRWSWEVTHAGPRIVFDFGQGRSGELGFRFLRTTRPPQPSRPGHSSIPLLAVRQVVIPLWLPSGVALILPVISLRRQVIARKRRRSLSCVACGYSLTGNTSGICPECGTAIE